LLLPLIASAYGIVFVAELPDKTALASLCLATRYPARQVVLGAWLAFLVQTVVAVAAGSALRLLPGQPVRVAAGLGFLVFAGLAWRRRDEAALPAAGRERVPAWVACFLVVFAAEWGDLTQLATAALVAQTREPLSVAVGAVAALWTVTVLAALAGDQLGRYLSGTLLNRVSAILFAVVGLFVLLSAVRGG
jgi:putative Ca2+/H+ antiporter (TMEM165/GDT1 family)